jgi:hypothetical protein
MIADLKAVTVQTGDFVPGHVVALVRWEVEPLRDEERRTKAILLEQGGDHCCVRLAGIVKRQHNELVRYRLQGRGGSGRIGHPRVRMPERRIRNGNQRFISVRKDRAQGNHGQDCSRPSHIESPSNGESSFFQGRIPPLALNHGPLRAPKI